MPAINRRSAMRVRGGRVAKKNNWTPDVREYYARRQSEIQIERTEPGRGVRHVVTVAQLREFLEILPDWDELGVGLEAELFERLQVEIVQDPGSADFELCWTEAQARAYMLTDVLVHELGHHHDRMTSRGGRAARGEPYAEHYARRVGAEVWPQYVQRFGI